MDVGKLSFECPVFLAPMARVTNAAFRKMCHDYGCDLVFTEMLNSEAIIRDNDTAVKKAKIISSERPTASQIFGHDPKTMSDSATLLESDVIDINMGCPDRQIMRQGSGAALLSDLTKAKSIMQSVIRVVHVPVSVKIRLGKSNKNQVAKEMVNLASETGISFVTIHARTVDQGYSGDADWDAIMSIVKTSEVPIIANGDIDGPVSAARCLEMTGAAGVMIGRASLGNPYIFFRIKTYLNTGVDPGPQSNHEKFQDFFRYYDLLKEHDCLIFGELKTHAHWFTKSIPGMKETRRLLTHAKDESSILKIMESAWKSI